MEYTWDIQIATIVAVIRNSHYLSPDGGSHSV